MIKVLEVISDTNVGGAGVLLVSRLRHSDRKRFHTVVLLPAKSQLIARFRRIGIETVEMKGCQDRSADMGSVWEIMGIIRRVRPDLINCHGCLCARIAATLCRVPVRVYTRHCTYPLSKFQKSPPVRLFYGTFAALLSHRALAVATAVKHDLLEMGVPSHRISVVINGAEALKKTDEAELRRWREELGIRDGQTVVGINARLEACKDHACFLRAAERLHRRSNRYFFLIVGDGSLRKELEAEAERRGLRARVAFVGFVEDVSPFVNLMDIHVNCSVGTETSSLAISEAMSVGVPTIASDYGGNPYMVRDGENGFLFPKGNDKALAACIEKLSSSPALYARLSQNAKNRFEHELNAESMTKKTERLYARLYQKYARNGESKV